MCPQMLQLVGPLSQGEASNSEEGRGGQADPGAVPGSGQAG